MSHEFHLYVLPGLSEPYSTVLQLPALETDSESSVSSHLQDVDVNIVESNNSNDESVESPMLQNNMVNYIKDKFMGKDEVLDRAWNALLEDVPIPKKTDLTNPFSPYPNGLCLLLDAFITKEKTKMTRKVMQHILDILLWLQQKINGGEIDLNNYFIPSNAKYVERLHKIRPDPPKSFLLFYCFYGFIFLIFFA